MYLCFGLVCRSHFPTSHDTVKNLTHILKSCNREKSKHKSQQDYLLYQKIRERKKVPRAFFEKQIESYLLRERIAYYYFTESSLIN